MTKPQNTFAEFRQGVARLWRGGLRDGWALAKRLLSSLFGFIERWLFDSPKARYGVAVTRMLLATAALGLLAANFSTRFYSFGTGGAWSGDLYAPRSDFPKIWFLSSFQSVRDNDALFTMLYLVLAVLAVLLLIGYRTRIVMPVFLIQWISFVELQDMLGDQGDNIFRIAMIALLFADTGSRWSIDAKRRAKKQAIEPTSAFIRGLNGGPVLPDWLRNLSHNLAIVVITCQVSFVYVSGAFYKAGGSPWAGGTALYAPINVDHFGPWPELSEWLTRWGPGVALLTYLSLLTQAFFPALLINAWTRRAALILIAGFHLGIAFFMGLPWFSLSMIAIDAVFIRDVTWERMAGWITGTYRGKKTSSADAENVDEAPESDASATPDAAEAGEEQPVADVTIETVEVEEEPVVAR